MRRPHARLADSPECPVSGPDYSLPLTSPIADLCQSSRAHLALPHSPKLLPSPCWSLQLLTGHAGVGDGDAASPSSGASRAAAAAALPPQRRRRRPGSRRSAKPAYCCTHCPRLATLATAAAAAGTGLQHTGSKWQRQQRRRHGERHDPPAVAYARRATRPPAALLPPQACPPACIPSFHPRLLPCPSIDPHLADPHATHGADARPGGGGAGAGCSLVLASGLGPRSMHSALCGCILDRLLGWLPGPCHGELA